MKKPYCCEASRDMYEQYYVRQQRGNGEFPVYVGATNQRGHGLGNIIGSLFRRILPELKMLAPHALRTGANMFDDVSNGKTWKQAARKRIPEGLKEFAFPKNNQSGSGICSESTRKRGYILGSKQEAKKKRRKDILD